MIDSVSNRNIKVICMNINFATIVPEFLTPGVLEWRSAGVSTSEHQVDSEAVS